MTAWAGAEPVYEGENKIYYRLSDGTMGNEHWEKKGQDWYYVGEDGHILKDNVIAAYDDNYYVLDESGRMLRSQTVFKNGLSYVIDESGAAKPEETEEELILREYASSIITDITNNSMTLEEKCDAVFNYLWVDLAYDQTNETDGNIVDSAMKAFDLHRGNCYVLLAKAHYLYQAIGVKDMVVQAVGTNGEPIGHWWNLIKIGDRYYHTDKTPFAGFAGWNRMTTEEFLESGKDNPEVNYLHQFDQTNYPRS